jgi:hypothetical protein
MLLRKYPRLLGNGGSLFGMLHETAAGTWRALVGNRSIEIDVTVKQLERIDSLDFAPFLTMTTGERSAAEEITKLFRRAVPDVYWYYFFQACWMHGIMNSFIRRFERFNEPSTPGKPASDSFVSGPLKRESYL